MANETTAARFWNRTAPKYASSKIGDLAGYERTIERTRHFLRDEDHVLEFGCGTGTTALELAPFVDRLLATDISQEMIAIARQKAEAENRASIAFEVTEPGSSQWADETFDCVLGFNILHLIIDRQLVLENIRRVLKPGGYFISKTPCLNDMSPFAIPVLRIAVFAMAMVGKAPPVAFVSAEELEGEIEAAGFTIVERGRHASKGKDIRPFLVAQK
ncbi:MAG: class I SAM-dependent methyltransferase [Methyloligella sp. ZOD6]